MATRLATRIGATVAIALALTACDSWLGSGSKTPLPGKRISVLSKDKDLQPEIKGNKVGIQLPPPDPNDEWPQAGGYPNHAMHHMQIADHIARAWKTNVGSGSTNRVKLLAQPVVAENRVFTQDADNRITAVDAKNGDKIWRVNITPDDIEGGSGGGIAYDEGRLYISTGFAQVVAMDSTSGAVLWRQKVSGPMRGAPTVRNGRVFVITVDNQLHCLSTETGKVEWTHQGIVEQAAVLAGNSPAVEGNIVIVPYSSGELYALRVESGAVLWQDSLSNVTRTRGAARLTDIGGRPIIDRGRVYAVGHSDTLVAIDLRSGRRLWEREIGGIQSPWVAGDYLFMVTNNNEAIAVESKTGRIAWITELQTWEDPEDKKGRISWAGPVLASDRLILGASNGWILVLSPYTGDPMGSEQVSSGITIQPAVANGAVYFFNDDADVVAYR
jgi:outer membrane protein assembly factor BamB